jgi:hypothetical protein
MRSSLWSLARYLLLLGFSGLDKGRDYSQGRTMLFDADAGVVALGIGLVWFALR